jgi:hypothetical protein
MSFYAGVSPVRENSENKKMGVALHFLASETIPCKHKLSILKCLLHLEVLIAHCFIEWFLSLWNRMQATSHSKLQYHLEVLEESIGYLDCPNK